MKIFQMIQAGAAVLAAIASLSAPGIPVTFRLGAHTYQIQEVN